MAIFKQLVVFGVWNLKITKHVFIRNPFSYICSYICFDSHTLKFLFDKKVLDILLQKYNEYR